MASKFTSFIENFTAGEVSPTWRGRIDTKLPSRGCRRLENFYLMPSGGIRRREGSYIVTEALSSSVQSILIPYVHDPATTYVIEMSGQNIRVVGEVPTEDGYPSSPSSSAGGSSSTGNTVQGVEGITITNSTFDANITSWNLGTWDGESGGDWGSATAAWNSGDGGSARITNTTSTISAGQGTAAVFQQLLDTTIAADVPFKLTFRIRVATNGTASTLQAYINISDRVIDSLSDYNNAVQIQLMDISDQSTWPALVNDGAFHTFTVSAISNVAIATPYFSIATYGDDFTSGSVSTFDVSSVSLNAHEYLITAASDVDDVNEVSFVQTPEGLFATGASFPPHKLRFTGTAWTWTEIVFKDGPYFDTFDETYGATATAKTVTTAGGAVGASITVTFSSSMLSTVSGDEIGRFIRIRPNDSSAWGYGKITAVASATSCTVLVKATIANTSASAQWRLGAWSQRTGYPRTNCFHQQRHVYGGTSTQPQTIWGSSAEDPENFAPDDGSVDEFITDLTAFTFDIATREPELIQWLMSKSALLVGTNRQIHTVNGSANEAFLSALNISINSLIKEGSAFIRPIEANDTLFFTQLYRRNLMELYYDTARGRHVARDLMIQSDHLSDKYPIIAGGFQQYPYNLTLLASDQGELLGLTYDLDSGIRAWNRQILGGNFGGNNPLVESIIQIPGGTQDQIWMVVKRTINGSTKRTIEVFANAPLTNSTRTDTLFLDAGVKTTVLAGPSFQMDSISTLNPDSFLSHLEGATIGVVSNGVYLGTDTVTGGLPVTNTAATFTAGDKVDFGLLYTSVMETNTVEPITNVGSAPGYDMRLYEVNLRLQNSLKGEIGFESATTDALAYPSDIDPTDEASETYTGDIKVKFPHGWDRDNRIYISQTEPYPLTVTLLALKMITGNI